MPNQKNKYFVLFLLIILLAIAIRIYFFDRDMALLSSDESEYAVMAESFGDGRIDTQWPYYRPFLLPLIFGGFSFLGFGLFTFKIILILLSLCSIILIYLLGKDLFNEKVGLFAAFFLAFFPDEILHSERLLLNGPALTMFLFSIYLFQKAYFKESKNLLYLSGIVTGLAILVYTQNLFLILLYLLFLLIVEGSQFLKQTKYVYFFLISIFIYLLNFLYSWLLFGNPIKMFVYGLWTSVVDTHSRTLYSTIFKFLSYMPNYLSWFYIPLLLLSLIFILIKLMPIIKFLKENKKEFVKPSLLLLPFLMLYFLIKYFVNPLDFETPKEMVIIYFLGTIASLILLFISIYLFRKIFDKSSLFLNNRKNLKIHLFLSLSIFTGFFGVVMMTGNFQSRYFIQSVVPLFLYFGVIINLCYEKLGKTTLRKIVIISLIFLLLILGSFVNFKYTSKLVSEYNTETWSRDVGTWLKNNSNETDVIFGTASLGLVFYSNREWKVYPTSRLFGNESYNYFLEELHDIKPKFLVLSYDSDFFYGKEIYFKFLKDNSDKLNLVYSYRIYNSTNIEVYDLTKFNGNVQ